MVFKASGAHTFKLKVAIPTRNEGKPRTFSTGAQSKEVAEDVERMVDRMKARREWAALEAVFDDLISLGEVYDADVSGSLAARMAALRDTDLDPYVVEWAKKANAKYVRQVRRLVKEGERFPASSFRRKRISEFLAQLTCDDPTRNRYRAALSVFAKWLVEREVLETNPVRDVAMYKEHDPRMVWMTWADSVRVADAAREPYRTLFYLMAASGMELGAALRVTRADVVLEQMLVHARGSKTAWRNRVVKVEPFARKALADRCKSLMGAAAMFDGCDGFRALEQWKDAQQAVKIDGHRIHDLRHTYAVNALKMGYKPSVVAHQLGHKDASMVIKVYGRFIPDASDYEVTEKKTAKRARK